MKIIDIYLEENFGLEKIRPIVSKLKRLLKKRNQFKILYKKELDTLKRKYLDQHLLLYKQDFINKKYQLERNVDLAIKKYSVEHSFAIEKILRLASQN